ncbi:hypothetical protein ThidrDRAFT_1535 [Thiorhodococcus drewsii AZ1]|uniref:Uncharacterized protein n=1 Tax=Thiorhodococcus drewsii AZ1 TaxID=765913 RepID=G2DZS2_9GAMM|nr:hypothetical protein [Thiorhodococcus drewsii]EGV31961.1 hypothetical protein ThidrDRAFT_1535 [Thiorhodococcus drewsii AZ1]
MEYSKTFALLEAVALVGLAAWLFYLNASSSRRSSDDEDHSQAEREAKQKDTSGS